MDNILLLDLKTVITASLWWCTPLILVLGKLRQVDLSEFEANLGYKVIKPDKVT